MKKLIYALTILLLIAFPLSAHAALTKSGTVAEPWTAIAQNTVVEGTTTDISANYKSEIAMAIAATSTTAATNGLEVRCQMSTVAAGDNHWIEFASFQTPTGTAVKQDITDNPLNSGSVAISIAATASFTKPTGTDNGWRYIKDTADITKSETVLQVDLTTNNHIDILDGTTNTHQNTADLYNIVNVYVIPIPDTALRVRVVYNNCKDAAGSTFDVHYCIIQITAI